MPIKYEIQDNGRFINAKAYGIVTDKDFVEYEVAHAGDERIKSPADELLEITSDADIQLTREGILEALQKNKELAERRIRHRCAIVVSCAEKIAWDLARFYESMARLHGNSSVIVFASSDVAKVWLDRAGCKLY